MAVLALPIYAVRAHVRVSPLVLTRYRRRKPVGVNEQKTNKWRAYENTDRNKEWRELGKNGARGWCGRCQEAERKARRREEQSRKRKECTDARARGRDGGVVRGEMWPCEKSLLAVSSFSEFLLLDTPVKASRFETTPVVADPRGSPSALADVVLIVAVPLALFLAPRESSRLYAADLRISVIGQLVFSRDSCHNCDYPPFC